MHGMLMVFANAADTIHIQVQVDANKNKIK